MVARSPEIGYTDAAFGFDSQTCAVLSSIDRLTELLYGIILVLTFTGTLRVAAQGGDVGVEALQHRVDLGFRVAGADVDIENAGDP